jgi:hypothetical protein
VPGKCEHQPHGVLIVIAAGKADHMHIVFAGRDRVSDMLRALDRINDQHEIPHALSSVSALVAGPSSIAGHRDHHISRGRSPKARPRGVDKSG